MTTLRRRYALTSELGRGATGVVWRAEDAQLGRRVAVKLLHSELDADYLRSTFEREARTMARLRSPNIVQVFDAGLDHGQPFIVMELLEGESLEARLQRHPRLPLAMVADLFVDVANGMSTIHGAGIVHRDLKPANIFLAREPGREVVKLLDFGIAALVPTSGGEGEAVLVGTPRYMSPERFDGKIADARSDVWSLGVVAYEMLTGVAPFVGETLLSVRRSVFEASPLPATRLVPELPAQVDEFFARVFAVDTKLRFSSVSAMANELLEIARTGAVPVLRILLVDDEPDMEFLVRQAFRQQLRQGRYELFFASDGHAALSILHERSDIDVILSDILMPGMDGLTFLGKVPDINPLARVVMISAYSDMANIRSAMNRGAFDFLCKPIDLSDLERTVEKTALHVSALRAACSSRLENDRLRSVLGHGQAAQVMLTAEDPRMIEVARGTVVSWRIEGLGAAGGDDGEALVESAREQWATVHTEVVAERGVLGICDGYTATALFWGEGHVERAVRTCLSVVACFDEGGGCHALTGVAAGVASGSVVSSPLSLRGNGNHERAFLGEAAERARALQTLACPGQVLVCPVTRGTLGDSTEFDVVSPVLRDVETDGAHVAHGVALVRSHHVLRETDSATPLMI